MVSVEETPVIQVEDLRMRYGSLDVLDGVEFEVHQGEVVTLPGPNGAGKTTTIEILEGFRELPVSTPKAKREFHDIVHRLADLEETTILLTTHDLDEAERLADRILILAGGRIVADGTADALAREINREAQVRWSRNGEHFAHATPDPTGFVRELFSQYGDDITDLEVRRATLEDTQWIR